jgi:hypothetical protein
MFPVAHHALLSKVLDELLEIGNTEARVKGPGVVRPERVCENFRGFAASV